MTYRVIQWTTGHVGREAVKGIIRHPELELVGCYAWSEHKAGKDVGELCGIKRLRPDNCRWGEWRGGG